MKSLSRVRLLATPWTAAYQAPPSMGFSKQEYWSGVPLPSPTFHIWSFQTVTVFRPTALTAGQVEAAKVVNQPGLQALERRRRKLDGLRS